MKAGDLEVYEWDLEGEKIIREPRSQAWRILLNHSFRQNGKVKKVQIYMRTLSWWDVVDGYLGLCESWQTDEVPAGFPSSDGWGIFFDKVVAKFPDVHDGELWKLFETKAAPIEQSIISEFKKMEEYRWVKINLKLRAKIKDEEEKSRDAEERIWEKTFRDHYRQKYHYQSNYCHFGISESISLTPDEARIINNCYRDMALKLHPDKGGGTKDMQILNGLRDKLRKGLKV